MVGFAGDYDFDTIGAMLLDPELEGKIGAELVKGSGYTNRYMQHQIRFQLLQAVKGAGDGSIAKGLEPSQHVLEAGRLAVANEHIGKISSLMTSAKRSVLSYTSDEKTAANAMGLLEWIEQKPIGFKHVDPAALTVQLDALNTAFESGNKDKIYSAVSGFLKSDAKILEEGFDLSSGDAARISKTYGLNFGTKIEGFNLRETLDTVSMAITRGKAENLPMDSNVHRGRSAASAIRKEILSIANVARGSTLVTNVEQAFSNMLGAAGQGVISNHKGVAALAAVGGLTALASFNSQPREMVGPGKQLNANVEMKMNQRKAAKRVTPDDVKPNRPPVGNPMGPNLLSQRRAMIASHPVPTDRFVVRARANHPDDISMISQQLQSFAVGGSSMNIVNTNRSINNPYGQANKAY